MLTDMGTLNPQIRSGPMPMVKVASLLVFSVEVIRARDWPALHR